MSFFSFLSSFQFSLSLLPAHLAYVEIFLVRLFLLLALLTIGPWLSLILYDFLLYVFRVVVYDVPFIGGRARGQQRPRAPSMVDGNPRRFSLGAGAAGDSAGEKHGADMAGRGETFRRLVTEEERDMRSWEVLEDDERKRG